MSFPERRGTYGIDAPYAPAGMLAGAIVCVALAILVPIHGLLVTAAFLCVLSGVFLHASTRGKFVVWRKILDGMQLRGDERVLDMGCGRGAVLLMAAGCLPRGLATGVDIWSTTDQSGNALEATRANAAAEGVADRVELHTGDMRKLPFADASFDAVVSSLAIHNIGDRQGREAAIEEAWRVLRPGGSLRIVDILCTRQYVDRLHALGAPAIRRNLGWRMWWGGPWVPTYLVESRKPTAA